jgi:alpha-tubulin suppressor-like RCC1 family protein
MPALVSISTKTSHVCGLTAGGEAWCWGDNSTGQLGDDTSEPRNGPVRVAGDARFSAISVGMLFSCALALDGTAYCWGLGTSGTLGQIAPDRCGEPEVACAKSPLPLAGLSFLSIGAELRHTCAVATTGVAWCWGFNFPGETGSRAYGESVLLPQAVAAAADFAWIGAGDAFTCALTTAGRAHRWGSADRGELGRQVGSCSTVYIVQVDCTPVPGAANTASTCTTLSVGTGHVCSLTPAGAALCWGENGQGQLGKAGRGFTLGTFPDAGLCVRPSALPRDCGGRHARVCTDRDGRRALLGIREERAARIWRTPALVL